jgi:hypothetical protein
MPVLCGMFLEKLCGDTVLLNMLSFVDDTVLGDGGRSPNVFLSRGASFTQADLFPDNGNKPSPSS